MQPGNLKAGLVSFSGAFVASLCCLLPLVVVLFGLGSGAFVMVTMQYRSIFLPIGVMGVAVGYSFILGKRVAVPRSGVPSWAGD